MIRVVKIGGSLFEWPELSAALRRWLFSQPSAFNILIAGGGALADVIRQADRDFSFGDERSHWLCIDALSISTRMIAALLTDYPLISIYHELRSEAAVRRSGGAVFDPRDFLVNHESSLPGRPLPHDWTVTSDAIAARLAEILPADELVLLKSSNPPSASLVGLAERGYVDRYFPTAAASLSPPRFVNLRVTAI